MTWPRQKAAAELRAEWEANRQRVADRWFRGDTDLAEAVFDALPYSDIPDWSDLDVVMEAINQSGDDREVAARALREAVELFADELGSAGSSILLGHADGIEKGEVDV